MDNAELRKKLNQLTTEDIIWIIYIGIIVLSWYSNSLERKYFIYKDNVCKEKYRNIIIIIFIILIFVYTYFLKDSFGDLMNLKESDSNKKKKLVLLSFIASLFIMVSGVIYLYIALEDEDLNVELAFN